LLRWLFSIRELGLTKAPHSIENEDHHLTWSDSIQNCSSN